MKETDLTNNIASQRAQFEANGQTKEGFTKVTQEDVFNDINEAVKTNTARASYGVYSSKKAAEREKVLFNQGVIGNKQITTRGANGFHDEEGGNLYMRSEEKQDLEDEMIADFNLPENERVFKY